MRPRWKWVLTLGIVLLALAPYPAQAHGGGTPQLVAVPVGPYHLSVWTQPEPPRVGTVHFTVALFRPAGEADEPVTDATVRLRLTPEADGVPLEAVATRDQALNPFYYEADVRLTAPGRWQVQVLVAGPEGEGQAAFVLEVEPMAPWWAGWRGAALALLALVLIFFVWGGRRT